MEISEEKYQELEHQLEETKKAQSGSDRQVTELRAKLSEYESGESGKETATAEKEKLLDRKERALNYALQKGIPPEEAFSILGLNEASDEDRLDDYADKIMNTRYEERQEFAKKAGRKVHDSVQTGPTSYSDLLNMSEDQLKKIPNTVEHILEKSAEENRPTMRKKLWGMI